MISVDSNWTLFLDRDGVINERLPGDYVSDWEQFQFYPGNLEALAFLASIFSRIIVVTNQQGIGKGLMREDQLNSIHAQMKLQITDAGGRIDGIYACPDLKSKPNNCRKPAPAMAWQAQQDFPEIDFQKSIMVGDSLSDIAFGNILGMQTVLITSKTDELDAINLAIQQRKIQVNYSCKSLKEFKGMVEIWND